MTLPPCHICGAPCRVEVFGPNKAIQGALTMWGCSASTAFGGTCSNIVGSLTEDNWRELNPSPPAADADLVERLRRRGNRQDHGLMMHGEFLNPDGPAAAARIEALSRPARAMAQCLQECSDDLESELLAKGVYTTPEKMARDMEPVLRARAMLAAKEAG